MSPMRALVYAGAGDAGVIQLREVPTPVPGEGQVLVRVHAAGLNRADILQRLGRYPAPPGWPPDIPGLEYAGVVEALGPGVTRWRAGDRVMGLVGGGAQAEYVVVYQDEALAALPVSPATRAVGEALVAEFDTSIDWEDPGGPSPWGAERRAAFDAAMRAFVATLRQELAGRYTLLE